MTDQLHLSLSSDPEEKDSPTHHDRPASPQSTFRPWSKGQSNSPWQTSFTSVYLQTLKQRTVQLIIRAQLHLSLSSDPEEKDSSTHHDRPASPQSIFRPWRKGQFNSPWEPSFTSVYLQTLKKRTVQLTMTDQLHLSLSSDPEAKDSPAYHESPASPQSIFRPWSKGQSSLPLEPSFTSVYLQTLKKRTVQLTMRAQLHLISSDRLWALLLKSSLCFLLIFRTRTLSDTGSYLSNILYKSVLYFTICLLQCWC